MAKPKTETETTKVAAPPPPPEPPPAAPPEPAAEAKDAMSDDELAKHAPLRMERPRPTEEQLAELDEDLTDAEFEKLAEIRAKRLGGGRIAIGGKVMKHTGRWRAVAQLKCVPLGETEGRIVKVGEVLALNADDVKAFTFDRYGNKYPHPSIEPELV